jgi:hypothetical protein
MTLAEALNDFLTLYDTELSSGNQRMSAVYAKEWSKISANYNLYFQAASEGLDSVALACIENIKTILNGHELVVDMPVVIEGSLVSLQDGLLYYTNGTFIPYTSQQLFTCIYYGDDDPTGDNSDERVNFRFHGHFKRLRSVGDIIAEGDVYADTVDANMVLADNSVFTSVVTDDIVVNNSIAVGEEININDLAILTPNVTNDVGNVAYSYDTDIELTNTGTKVSEWKTGGVEKMNLNKDGRLEVHQLKLYELNSNIPATINSTGEKGDIKFSSSHIYFCINPNSWRRVALTTW